MNDLDHVMSFVDPFVHRPAQPIGVSLVTCPRCHGSGRTCLQYATHEVDQRCGCCHGRCTVEVERFRE